MYSHINRTADFIVRALTEREAVSKPLRAPAQGCEGDAADRGRQGGVKATKAKPAAAKAKPVAHKAKEPVKVVAKPRTNGTGRTLAEGTGPSPVAERATKFPWVRHAHDHAEDARAYGCGLPPSLTVKTLVAIAPTVVRTCALRSALTFGRLAHHLNHLNHSFGN